MGSALAKMATSRGGSVLWLCHRRELASQAIDSNNRYSGPHTAGPIQSDCPIRVSTVQALMRKRGPIPGIRFLVLDECHHYRAEQWGAVAQMYPVHTVGLTATPQRADGLGLGSMFDSMVVSASYTQLREDGHLADCEVLRPDGPLMSNEVAQSPIQAYCNNAMGRHAFLFAKSVKDAEQFARDFREAGVRAAVVTGKTDKETRRKRLQAFAEGTIQVLCNVFVLTEGVDIPRADVCILTRGCSHASIYLQMVGRILRPFPGKGKALLIDLPGVSHEHGLPGEDVKYSLDGDGIQTAGKAKKKADDTISGDDQRPPPTIYSMELRRVYAGSATPTDHKDSEWRRLRSIAVQRGYSLAWVANEYKKLFDHIPPQIQSIGSQERQREYRSLIGLARSRGYKNPPGWAGYRYKETFGKWPPRLWSWKI